MTGRGENGRMAGRGGRRRRGQDVGPAGSDLVQRFGLLKDGGKTGGASRERRARLPATRGGLSARCETAEAFGARGWCGSGGAADAFGGLVGLKLRAGGDRSVPSLRRGDGIGAVSNLRVNGLAP